MMNNVDQEVSNLIKNFESLRDEHVLILSINRHEIECENEIDANLIKLDLPRIQNSSDKVLLGIEDAELLKVLSKYIKVVDAERKNQIVNLKKLKDESNWLRDEVEYLHQNLKKSDEKIVELEEENKQLKFLLELKAYGSDLEEKDGNIDKNLSQHRNSLVSNEEVDDKYTDGDDENKESPNSENAVNHSAGPGFELPPRLKTLHNLVIQYAAQGRYEVAIPLCKQTLEDLEKTSGRNHPDVATMLNILALVYRDQNKFSDSVNLLKEALSIREATLGPVHVSVAANLNNLAVLYGKQKKFHEAEPLCKRSLMIREQLLGPNHPDVAKQLNNLALLCQNQGKYSEVETYYHKAIKIYTEAYGPNCVDVNKTKNNLASAYMKQSKFKDAEMMYKEILNQAHEGMCGAVASNNKTIWMLAEEKQYGQGESFSSAAEERESWSRILQKDWSEHYTTLKNLASLYRRQNKLDAADIIDDLANRNASKKEENAQNSTESRQENPPTLRSQGIPRDRPSSVCVTQETWNVARTNQMKANLFIKPNNFNKPIGPVKASRTSLADKFTSKFVKDPYSGEGSLQVSMANSWQSHGDGRMKKASSMSLLPGAPQNKNNTSYAATPVQPAQTWLSKGRTASIENLKKAFGKRT